VDERDELLGEALIESFESLLRMERDLSLLEKDPTSQEALGSLFRTVHTIKGACGAFGLEKAESIAHKGEDLLARLRDGTVAFDAAVNDALHRTGDALGEMLSSVEACGSEGAGDYEELARRLARLAAEGLDSSSQRADPSPLPRAAGSGSPETGPSAPAPERTIRLDALFLERLKDLVLELDVAKDRILGFTVTRKDPALRSATRRLDFVAGRLAHLVRTASRRPIRTLFERTPRQVRHVSAACGKEVRVEMAGAETEVDHDVLHSIGEALSHIVRNAIDHGIETPTLRLAKGKAREGLLRLAARASDGELVIEVFDDGAGIDLARVRQKARDMGLADDARLATMDDDELTALVFRPGFSTKDAVTGVSGRGIGLDVVRTNVARLGGTVAARSESDRGTTITIRVPRAPRT
jgi:two-component system chemotaxis sensor kinase CheA